MTAATGVGAAVRGLPLFRSTLARHLLLAVVGGVAVVLVTGRLSSYHDYQLAILGAYLCSIAGLTMLTGMNGQLSLGHAALMAVGGYSFAMTQQSFTNHNVSGVWLIVVSLLIGTVITAAVGAVVGVAAARLRGPYLAGATLAMGVALPSITSHYTSVFKGDQGLSVTFAGPPSSLGSNISIEEWQAWISLGAALVVMLLLANLGRSAVGRTFRAVRDDDIAAQLAGIHIGRVRVLAFAVSAAAAGLGGGVYAIVLQTASPGEFDLTLSLTLVSGVVIGGLGSLTGAVWGSIVVVYLGIEIRGFVDRLHLGAASAQHLHDNLPLAVYGLLLVVAMLALPGGIQSVVRRLGTLVLRRSVPPRGGQ